MYIPPACPEDTPGVGPSSRPLEEHLVSPGGGSGRTPASFHSGEPRSRSPRPWSRPQSLGTIFGDMNVDEPSVPALSGSLLAGRLKETMFPLLRQGEVPNQVNMLLDGKKYLHLQVSEYLYHFKGSSREDVLRNISTCVPPPLTGAIPPGAVRLFNTTNELDKLYALVAKESEECNLPNTKLGQRFMAWLNRYLGDTSHTAEAKPPKNRVISYALSNWKPPVWVTARRRNKCNGFKKAYQAAWESASAQCGTPPLPSSSIPEVQQPPAASSSSSVLEVSQPPATSSLSSVLKASQPPAASSSSSILEASHPPAASSSSAPAPVMTPHHTFGVMSTSQQPILPSALPPLILTRRSCTTYLRQDGLPRGGPGWGDEIAEWQDFIHCLCRSGMAHRFLGIRNEANPQFREPPSDRRLRGFILEGYFAPRFQYDSNHNGWCCSFARMFAVPGRYRVIIEREGWAIVPGRSSLWTEAIDQAPSPLAIARYLAWNGLSFQEADDLYEWGMAVLHEGATGHDANPNITLDLVIADTACEGPGQSLEYYEKRADQVGFLVDFRDIEALPSDTNSLLGVNEVAGYMPAVSQSE